MKTHLLLIIIIISINTVNAQVEFGVKGGINISNIVQSNIIADKFKPITEWNAGLMTAIPVSKSFLMQAEIMYSIQGGNLDDRILHYDYLNVPVILKYQHHSGLFAVTGPQISFMLKGIELYNGETYEDFVTKEKVDLSWIIGIGYKFQKTNLGVDFRYNIGLTNTEKLNNNPLVSKNTVFQIDLFYTLFKM